MQGRYKWAFGSCERYILVGIVGNGDTCLKPWKSSRGRSSRGRNMTSSKRDTDSLHIPV